MSTYPWVPVGAPGSSLTATPACSYCGSHHPGTICPRVEEIEYHNDGTVRRVKLRPPSREEKKTT